MTKSELNENKNEQVAKRYSAALLDLCGKELSKEVIFTQITDVKKSLDNSVDLQKVIFSPIVSGDEKKNILDKIFGSDLNKTILNFLKLLVDKNRFDIFNSVVAEFRKEINKQEGLLEIGITSAIELNEHEKAMIKVKLENILNKQVELEWDYDSSIIGGLMFKIEDNIIDCSIKHKLQEIKREITL